MLLKILTAEALKKIQLTGIWLKVF